MKKAKKSGAKQVAMEFRLDRKVTVAGYRRRPSVKAHTRKWPKKRR